MEEYWNQFLSWLNSMANPQVRLAPPVSERFANSYRAYPDDPVFDETIPGVKRSVITNPRNWWRPGYIMQNVNDGDTVYTEKPPQKMGFNRNKKRTASNRDKNRREYKTMERRFNDAWQIAKDAER